MRARFPAVVVLSLSFLPMSADAERPTGYYKPEATAVIECLNGARAFMHTFVALHSGMSNAELIPHVLRFNNISAADADRELDRLREKLKAHEPKDRVGLGELGGADVASCMNRYGVPVEAPRASRCFGFLQVVPFLWRSKGGMKAEILEAFPRLEKNLVESSARRAEENSEELFFFEAREMLACLGFSTDLQG